jgi:hypothetical protein
MKNPHIKNLYKQEPEFNQMVAEVTRLAGSEYSYFFSRKYRADKVNGTSD